MDKWVFIRIDRPGYPAYFLETGGYPAVFSEVYYEQTAEDLHNRLGLTIAI
jgi:hypothetical protein